MKLSLKLKKKKEILIRQSTLGALDLNAYIKIHKTEKLKAYRSSRMYRIHFKVVKVQLCCLAHILLTIKKLVFVKNITLRYQQS